MEIPGEPFLYRRWIELSLFVYLGCNCSFTVNNTADLQGTLRSAIPQAHVPAPQAPAIRKSAVPFRGSFPLQLHKYSPYSKLMKKNMIEKAKAG